MSKKIMIAAFIVGVFSLTAYRFIADLRRAAPPPLVMVGDWSLTSHEDKSFGSKDLKGKVFIASYFFTRCPTICPKIMDSLNEVTKRFNNMDKDVHFVSFSIDVGHDTPSILASYRSSLGYDLSNWTFLTGQKQDVYHVVVDQMKLHVGEKEPYGEQGYNIAHIAELVLFDQNGNLRGKFGTDAVNLAQLERSAKLLVEKGA